MVTGIVPTVVCSSLPVRIHASSVECESLSIGRTGAVITVTVAMNVAMTDVVITTILGNVMEDAMFRATIGAATIHAPAEGTGNAMTLGGDADRDDLTYWC